VIDAVDLGFYRHQGHLTVNDLFGASETDAVIADIEAWGESFLAALPKAQRAWYVDGGVQARARDPRLVALVEQIIGAGVSLYFSQIFFKAPEGGGPKPAHQDNFYFGPTDRDGLVTAWIALDDATLENGCLYFGDGTNNGPVYGHVAPEAEPFNLQLPTDVLARQPMMPAPVRKGGVSFHHGNTFHRSGPNHSPRWRRACALHYVRNGVEFATPALPYDHALKMRIT
jgi:phytanoyl-CoA hydroxylase